MTTQSNTQDHMAWAKERLEEMDATLVSLGSNAGKLQGGAHANAASALAGMRAKRDAFQATIEQAGQAGATAHAHTKAALEAGWSAFQESAHAASTQAASTPTGSASASGTTQAHG